MTTWDSGITWDGGVLWDGSASVSNDVITPFLLRNGRIQFTTEAVASDDLYRAGLRCARTSGATRITLTAGQAVTFHNGLAFDASARLCCLDTDTLPAGTVWLHGLPLFGDYLCISSQTSTYVNSGQPFTAAGVLAASGI